MYGTSCIKFLPKRSGKQGIPRYYLTQYYLFHETALFLHGLTDRDSLKWSATVKSIKDDFDTIDFG